MESEKPLTCSQENYSAPSYINPNQILSLLTCKIYFNIILPSTLELFQVFFFLQVFAQKL